jgi:GH35 family endo-1,4-beta-xylanase
VVKGHPLTWHTVTADWLMDLSNADIARAQVDRIRREMGRLPMIRMVFDAAREANPRATLLLNDFDMSAAYECLIEGVLEAGIRIDALGLQSHMHQGYWGEEKTLGVRAGGTPKPSYEALHSLIKGEWWLAPTKMTTDEEGLVRFNGFLGEYEVSAAGKTATFGLDEPGEATVKVAL